MADPKHEESFRVVDRRLFTAEGELRPEALEEQRREQARAAQAPPQTPKAASNAASAAQDEGKEAAPEPPPKKPDRNFQLLVDLLARNAAAMLGGIPDPATGQAYLDIEGAREMIDILDTLRDKTQDNLAPEEERLISEVLGSLKLSYMEVSKAAAKAMREGAAKGRR